MGEGELGHRSCSEHISIVLLSSWSRRTEIFYRMASGKCILDGGTWQIQGSDENGLCRYLNGRLTVLRTQRLSRVGEISSTLPNLQLSGWPEL